MRGRVTFENSQMMVLVMTIALIKPGKKFRPGWSSPRIEIPTRMPAMKYTTMTMIRAMRVTGP